MPSITHKRIYALMKPWYYGGTDLQFRQYLKGKRQKFGIKLYTLCDPHGLILRFFIYCGVVEDMGGKGHAANVVLKLMQRKLNCGHSLYMDNYYNSVCLAAALLRRKTHCTGTLRLDRKFNRRCKSSRHKIR